MIRLKKQYEGKSAVVIMGGPSIIENNLDLGLIDKNKYTIFLESKSLTPYFLSYKLIPDFFLMFFPEKCHANALQQVIYQSLLAGIDLSRLLKPDYLRQYYDLKDNFDNYFEVWNPERSPHKKYKFKNHVVLEDSPFSLLPELPNTAIITRIKSEERFAYLNKLKNERFVYGDRLIKENFQLEKYFNPEEVNGCLMLNGYGSVNSAAIALFPILNYMGFKKIYFIGMDMSMLGSLEYSSLYTFRSLRHYAKFFKKARAVFNFNFIENKKKFMRPPYEFENFKQIFRYDKIEFINIFEPFEFALPLEGMRHITFYEFLNE